MKFPNAYQGIRKLFFAEILGILTFAVSLLYALIASGIKSLQGLLSFTSILLPVILGLSIITVVIRFFALGRAAQDEGTFGTAQIANLIYLVLTVLNQFVKNSLLGFAASIASICVTMLILTGIMRLALRLRNADVYDRGQLLKRLIWFLIFSPVLLAFAVALLMKSSAGAILFLVIALAFLAALLVEAVMYFCYLNQAKNMLRDAKIEEWDPLEGVSEEFRPDHPEANPW